MPTAIDVEVEVLGGIIDVEVEFDRHTAFYTDPSYGADADGRRGVKRTFVDDDMATNVYVDGHQISQFDAKFQDDVMASVEAWMERNIPWDEAT